MVHPWRAVVASERMAEVAARVAQGEDPAAVGAEFWRTVSEGPLWERDPEFAAGWRVTFLWQGAPELTHHVCLCGPVVFSLLDHGGCPFAHVAGTDIWHLTLRVPAGTRSTYAISPNGLSRCWDHHEEDARLMRRFLATWAKDPLNPKATVIPVNSMRPEDTPFVLSMLEAPDAPAQPWSTPQPGVASGLVQEHTFSSRILANTRRVWTYTPPGWNRGEREYPLLVAFDGWNAVEVTRLPVVLDNLIAAGKIPPVVAVLVDSGTLEMRMRELDCHEPFVAFLTDELLPWARERYVLAADRSRTLVAGVSAGGEAAVFAGLRRPDVFGKVIGQTTAVNESLPSAIAELAHRPATETDRLELYLDVGLLEIGGDRAFLYGGRQLNSVLSQAGHTVHYAELACGHDELVFGETIADGLSLLLPTDVSGEGE